MSRGLCVCLLAVLTLTPSPSPAANKEIQELQRDVAQLQDLVKKMQQSQDRQLGEIRVLVQQSLSAANDAGKSVAVIQSGFQQSLREQENKVVAPVVGLGSRMDQMSGDMRAVQNGLGDLLSQISKMQTQLTDLNNAVRVMQAPPPPPPATAGSSTGGAPPVPETPAMPAKDLYEAAMRDRSGGKVDLAIDEFLKYLDWYGNTELAPNAQFYIASIHAAQGDYDNAVKEYDMVLEKYQDNNKTPDALYGKGLALVRMGRRTDGAREFQDLLKRFPSHTLAAQSCRQLTDLGIHCSAAPSGPAKSPPKRGKK